MNFTEILLNGLISGANFKTAYFVGMFVTVIVAYLIGSVNFAILFSRRQGSDVRDSGSGNAGTTNMIRVYGRKVGVAVFVCDFLKAALAVFLGILFMPADGFGYLAAVFCMLGHIFPIYFNFRGGKGVAVFVGAMSVLNPVAAIISILMYIMVLLLSKYVSLSSMAMTLIFPLLNYYIPFSLFAMTGDVFDTVAFVNYLLRMLSPVLMAAIVCISHHANIKRLMEGTENRVGSKKH